MDENANFAVLYGKYIIFCKTSPYVIVASGAAILEQNKEWLTYIQLDFVKIFYIIA